MTNILAVLAIVFAVFAAIAIEYLVFVLFAYLLVLAFALSQSIWLLGLIFLISYKLLRTIFRR